jgi:protein involved in polysaccharide export with SLBB domain
MGCRQVLRVVRTVLGAALGLAVLLPAGCSLAGGNRLTLCPEGHPLLESTKELRRAACEPLALPRELEKQALPLYTVEPGDVLLVQPAELDTTVRIPGDQPVLPDGTISLGRYGRILVAGKTVDEIEAAVHAAVLAQVKDAGPITVRVVTRVSKVFYVLGEVNAPGAYPLSGRETVLDGILAAGGLNDRASRQSIVLSRPTPPDSCRVVLPICYREIVQLGDTATNYQIAPGDRIFVPSRTLKEGHSHRDCPPFGRPQVPCPGCAVEGHGGTESPAGAPLGQGTHPAAASPAWNLPPSVWLDPPRALPPASAAAAQEQLPLPSEPSAKR